MALKQFLPNKVAAVLGAGKFGTAVANLIAPNVDRVWLYTHKAEYALASQANRTAADQPLASNVFVTNDLVMVLRSCSVIFPVIPAAKFRGLMQQIAPNLTSEHMLIHGTKGLDFSQESGTFIGSHPLTMSQVIMQETVVRQIGCLAGPNLSSELVAHHPAVTVVASSVQRVLAVGEVLLTNDWFYVQKSDDLLSVEMCSVLKNIFAIGAGIIGGIGYQSNTYAYFITLSMAEMRYIMATMGIGTTPLLGPAGLGDVIATCGSRASRNYMIGYRLAQGEQLADILEGTKEVAEGVQTVKIIHQVMQSYEKKAPITEVIYRILFEGLPAKKGLTSLMAQQNLGIA